MPETREYTIHPYLLKEHRHRWYIVGLDDRDKIFKKFGLDRMSGLMLSPVKYIDREFDPRDYFKNTVGVISPEGDPTLIKISVRKPQTEYLFTQPWMILRLEMLQFKSPVFL